MNETDWENPFKAKDFECNQDPYYFDFSPDVAKELAAFANDRFREILKNALERIGHLHKGDSGGVYFCSDCGCSGVKEHTHTARLVDIKRIND